MCRELSRIIFHNLHYDTRKCILRSTGSKRLRLSPPHTHTHQQTVQTQNSDESLSQRRAAQFPPAALRSPSVLSPALSVPFGEGEFVKGPEILSRLFWEETLGCLSASAGKRAIMAPTPDRGAFPGLITSLLLHLWDWSAGPEGTHSGGLGQGREWLQIKFPEIDLREPTALSPT